MVYLHCFDIFFLGIWRMLIVIVHIWKKIEVVSESYVGCRLFPV